MFAYVLFTLVTYISTNHGATITVEQVNEDGFGDQNNNYAFAMEEFQGKLYVSTNNVVDEIGMALFFIGEPFNTDGTQIWRGDRATNGVWTWENVVDNGLLNPANYGVRKLQAVGNYLYAVTSNHVTGFEIWRTSDGTTWTVEVGTGAAISGGFGDDENKSGRGLYIFDGYIYVGVENRVSGGRIYRRQIDTVTGDYAPGSSWDAIVVNGNGNPLNWWFSDFVEYSVGGTNYLYVGTLNVLGFQVLRSSDGENFTPVIVGGNGAIGNSAAMDLVVYGGKLYVGTMNFFVGTSLFVSSDGENFGIVYVNGNGDARNAYTWWMQEYNGRLYVATFNTGDILDPLVPGEFDLFSKVDPSDPAEPWILETTNGFFEPFQYGIRSMEVFDGKLIIGTATATVPGALKVYEASPANTTFIYVPIELSYDDAREYCRSTYGTDLASVTTDGERDEIVEDMDYRGDDEAWFGLRTRDTGGQWTFVDFETCPNMHTRYKCIDYWLYQFKPTSATRPRCIGDDENGYPCAYYDAERDGADNDIDCNDELPFICEYGCIEVINPPYSNDGILGLIQKLIPVNILENIIDNIGPILEQFRIKLLPTTTTTPPITCAEEPIDLNTANIAELDTLPYIDVARAQQIIDSRPICSPLELTKEPKKISQITEGRLNINWDWYQDQSCDVTCCRADASCPPGVTPAPTPLCDEEPIDLNTATIAELDTLPYIDAARAQQIIDSRPICSPLELTYEPKKISQITVGRLNNNWDWYSDQSCDVTCCRADATCDSI